ncbi:chaperone [Lithospermum erythrorhizon]|uniref:Chaperone n=1 Tax=Lithospermum erythrorhizon TaxID=34254 RepID=A0AAV3Q7S4_LITER
MLSLNLAPIFTHLPPSIRCSAAAEVPAFPRLRLVSTTAAAEAVMSSPFPGAERSSNGNNVKVNAKEKWSGDRESYLTDDVDALPLPMTYPNSKPMSRQEIDLRLQCDPLLEDCKPVVYEWTGKCRSCQGSGYVSYHSKRGKETVCKCIPCQGIGNIYHFLTIIQVLYEHA